MEQTLRSHAQLLKFSCPHDVNVSKKAKEKEDNYGPLARALQLIIPITNLHLSQLLLKHWEVSQKNFMIDVQN